MNILVTGGGGFLGQAVCRALIERGDTVAALNRSHYAALDALGVEQHRGDIGDADAVHAACRGRDAVIHVAAKAGPGLYAPEYQRANIDGTRNVVEACRSHGIGLLVHTSSPSVVHAGGDIEGGDESLPLATHHPAPYPATKTEAERIALAANDERLKVCALRPHLIWGPGDNHLLPRLIERNRAGRLKLPAPDKKIDTVYIDNAADAHVHALDDLAGPGRSAGKAYFITNGEPRSVESILNSLLEAAGESPRIGTVHPKVAMAAATVVEAVWRTFRLKSEPPISRFVVDHLATAHWFSIEAARRDLGWTPTVSIDEGLARLAQREGRGTRDQGKGTGN
jgi:nucleoside-diphosphate-sugar epimerase